MHSSITRRLCALPKESTRCLSAPQFVLALSSELQTLYSLLSADSICRFVISVDSSTFRRLLCFFSLSFLLDYVSCYLTQRSFVGVQRGHHSLQTVQATICTWADTGHPATTVRPPQCLDVETLLPAIPGNFKIITREAFYFARIIKRETVFRRIA